MAVQLFTFVQFELPGAIGPADGRYVVRSPDGRLGHVLVISGTPRAGAAASAGGDASGPPLVSLSRATVIDAEPIGSEEDAAHRLDGVYDDGRLADAFAVLARARFAHRLAAADPTLHDLAPGELIVVRAGWGTGEEVARGRFSHAREIRRRDFHPPAAAAAPPRRRRASALRPEERFAALLGGRERPLLSEELLLRARGDFDHGRDDLAARQLDAALTAALDELEPGANLARLLPELEGLLEQTRAAVRAPLATEAAHRELVAHGLSRLEAALRARGRGGASGGVRGVGGAHGGGDDGGGSGGGGVKSNG